jgi:uncharacterized protein YerC
VTHISKYHLEQTELDNLYNELIHVFDRSSRKNKTKSVLNEFFTATEKIMLAKRLAVIALLSQRVPPGTISKTLAMSPVTIDLMSVKYESGRYEQLIKEVLAEKDIQNILAMVKE